MLMNNENDHSTSYRRLSDSTPSPILRRSKSVRASFRMLGSRWKSSSSGGTSKIDSSIGQTAQKNAIFSLSTASRDVVSERFGKDFNRNVKQPMTEGSDRLPSMVASSSSSSSTSSSTMSLLPQSNLSMKAKTKFFHAFAKENVSERHIQYEIPKNVAPKAAALLQIPVLPNQHQHSMNANHYHHHHHQQHHQQQQQRQRHHLKKHDLIKMDGKFNVHLDRSTCDLIANSNQFALLKSLSENMENNNSAHHNQDMFKPATIRRAPYWPNNQPLKFSKNLVLLVSFFSILSWGFLFLLFASCFFLCMRMLTRHCRLSPTLLNSVFGTSDARVRAKITNHSTPILKMALAIESSPHLPLYGIT